VRTLLVLSNQAHFAQAIQAVLEPARFQIIAKESVADAEFLLGRGAIDATILDAELAGSRTIRALEELKSCAPGSAVIIYTGDRQWQWEEDAYLLGVAHVLNKPVRGRLLNTLLNRLFPEAEPKAAALPAPRTDPGLARTGDGLRALEALRRFSNVFTHSLDARALLKQFLLLLREVIGVNRAIIFLRKPSTHPTDGPVAADDRWLRSACAIGLDHAVLQHFGLSLNAGIGGHLHRHGRVLRAGSAEAVASREITKEFQLLGAQIAIPILDRESLLGVAVFDERLTGEPFVNEEISLIFHLLEEIGLALRNSWLHDQIVANHTMIGDILSHLGSGAAVFGPDLDTLHANAAARRIFLPVGSTKTQLEFGDLPQQLGSMVFTVIKTGAAVPALKHTFPDKPGQIFSLEIVPFRAASGPNAALLLIEDVSEHERAQKLETEASNLRLVKSMAEHLAHEIGNALVPISTHQQLLKDQIADPEFQESLDAALASGVKRIARLSSQMMFLAREWAGDFGHDVAIGDLIVEAFHEAHTFHPGKKIAQLSFNKKTAPWKVKADPKALRHAFSEIMLNALQANPENPVVSVNLEESKAGEPLLKVEVRDSGQGFTPEAAQRAPEPFFSTRNVGLGIGLTVSRRIIENHRGKIEIAPSAAGESGLVRISLPLGEPATKE
jgi:signal transduction histidine kinase/ActR/RegA family two-component response regulator